MVVMRAGRRRVVLDLGPQPLDVDVEGLGVADVVRTPDAVDERLPGQHPAGVAHQQLQQFELLQRQRHLIAAQVDLVAAGVETQTADLEHLPDRFLVGLGRRASGAARPACGRPAPAAGRAW